MTRSLLNIPLALFFSVCLCGAAYSGDVEDGIAALEKGDFAVALEKFRGPAESGNAQAQYNIGVMYFTGSGVQEDYVKAAEWYGKAAENGHSDAKAALGAMHYEGKGMPLDFDEAINLFKQAAEQGHAGAQSTLGGTNH